MWISGCAADGGEMMLSASFEGTSLEHMGAIDKLAPAGVAAFSKV